MSGRPALHAERAGRPESSSMLFVHPNPMDAGSWLFQMAHLSDHFRTVAVDLPGYGRSPAWQSPFELDDLAVACWQVMKREQPSPAVIVGCSVGAHVALHMARLEPERAAALVLSGTGYHPPDAPRRFAIERRADFERYGLAYRSSYLRENFSESFRGTPTARWFESFCLERGTGDLTTILALFDTLSQPDPETLLTGLQLPVLIMGGSEDTSHARSGRLAALIPDSEVVTLEGAGHACHIEMPWDFDAHILDFLSRRTNVVTGLLPGGL